MVFSRQTSKGELLCTIEETEVSFFLNGNKIKEKSIAGIVPVESLKDIPLYKELYRKLKESGANHVWNYQVALYGDEAEIIKKEQKKARKKRQQIFEEQIKTSSIVVSEYLYNGAPAKAENNLFDWFVGFPNDLVYKKTGKSISHMASPTPEMINEINRFFSDIRILTQSAEKEYERIKLEQAKSECNSNLVGMTRSDAEKKAQEWDNIYNEGEEGYNPFR